MTETVVIADDGEENVGYRFSWALAIAGGVAATAVTFFLLTLGAGFGLLLVGRTAQGAVASPTFLTGGAIYFFIAQAFGFAVGGHLAGRLLAPLSESAIQEEFRAAAHGFVAWAVTVLATLAVLALASLSGTTTTTLYGASATPKTNETVYTSYLVDVLFRPAGATVSAAEAGGRAEAIRILDRGVVEGETIVPSDRDRLVALVAAEAGISRSQASNRVDSVQADAKHTADSERKTAGYTSLWIAASLLFGALVAMFAAVLAREEDDRDALR
jgi:hypothetical protein